MNREEYRIDESESESHRGEGTADTIGAATSEPEPERRGDARTAGGSAGDAEKPSRKFREFPLAEDVLEALDAMGFEATTPIQEKVIDPILRGVDIVGKAETGTGKTIGFAAPLVGKIDTARVAVQGLVLTPTRELAQQVAQVVADLGKRRGLRVALLVGGVHGSEQVPHLRQGSQVVVGTPGRVLDFLKSGILVLGWCETVVLDEADRMLDMGFIDEVGAILDRVPKERQTLLFSATIPQGIERILKRYMNDPEHYSTSRGLATVPDIKQRYISVGFPQKFRALCKILDANPEDTAIVFCNTRRQAIDLDRMLWGHGYSAGALHGDQEQDVRFRILEAFRSGDIKVLVATDVASRGLDIEAVSRVINFEVPDEAEAYVHRIGRTGRASKTGEAVTFVAPKERRNWQQIMRQTGFDIEGTGGGRTAGEGDAGDLPERERGGRRRGRRSRGGAGRESRGGRTPERSLETGAGPGPHAADEGRGAGEAGGGGPAEVRRRRRRRSRRRRGAEGPADGPAGGPESPAHHAGGPPSDASDAGAVSDLESRAEASEALEYWKTQEPRKKGQQERRAKMTLADIDDEFVKTEYFEVDESVLKRVEHLPPPAAPARSSGGDARGRGADRRSRRGGQHRSPRGRDAFAGPAGPGGNRPERSPPSRERDDASKGGGHLGRRPRRRRRSPADRSSQHDRGGGAAEPSGGGSA